MRPWRPPGGQLRDRWGAMDVVTVVREIERKYDPAAGGTAALKAVKAMTGTAGVADVSQQAGQLLDAVYYDTADLRLIGAGITLRRRTGGEDAGWHLKLPAGADTRDEIRLPLAAPGGEPTADAVSGTVGKRAAALRARADSAVPEELTALVRARTRARRWHRCCGYRPTAGCCGWSMAPAGHWRRSRPTTCQPGQPMQQPPPPGTRSRLS